MALNEPLRVLIVDDEELARMRLRTLVHAVPQPQALVVGEAMHAAQALSWLNHHACDLVLLDVRMPGLDGTELAAVLATHDPAPAVVFVTAHAEHAVRAFELDAVDYLTKPVRQDRLQAALQRAVQRLRTRDGAAPAEADADLPCVIVNDRGRMLRIPVSDALYFKAELKYVTLRTTSHTYVLDESLSELEQRLGPSFLRVHRNALVALRHVRALERRVLELGPDEPGETWAVNIHPVDEWVAVSRRQVTAVREALGRPQG